MIRVSAVAALALCAVAAKPAMALDVAARGAPAVDAAAPAALTLADALAIAIRNHPLIASQTERALAARENVDAATADLYPQIYGSAQRVFAGSNTRITSLPGGSITDPTVLGRGSAGISISQLITDFGRTSDLIAASEHQLSSEQDRVNAARDTVLFAATEAYYGVLRAQALLKVAESTVRSRSTLYDQVSRLRAAKLKSDLDVSFAKLALDQANLLQVRAESNLQDSWARLAEALGTAQVRQYRLADTAAVEPLPGTREDAIGAALARNPELQALEASRDAAHSQAEADAKAGLPVIAAQGFAGTNPYRMPGDHLASNYAAGGITLTIPIFTGGRLTAQERRSAHIASSADHDVETQRNALSRDVAVAWDAAATAYRNIAVTRQLFESSTKALDLTRGRYDIGLGSIVDLEQAEVAALEAEIAQSNARYDYLIERAFLLYREGGNAVPDIGVE